MLHTVIPQGYAPCVRTWTTPRRPSACSSACLRTTWAGPSTCAGCPPPCLWRSTAGLNDDLNGVERPASFASPPHRAGTPRRSISLAKWGSAWPCTATSSPWGGAVHRHGSPSAGTRSWTTSTRCMCDQWDWEKVHRPPGPERGLLAADRALPSWALLCGHPGHPARGVPPALTALPPVDREVAFVTTQELEDRWPGLTPREREDAWVKDHPTSFVMGIGGALKSGKPHDRPGPGL